MNNPADEELVRRFLDGREQAFRELFDRYYRKVFHLCYRFCGGDSNLAEEASQETFLQVYRSLVRFQFKSSFYTWLYRVTFNTCSILVKKDIRLRTHPVDGLEETPVFTDGEHPQEHLLQSEFRGAVHRILQELPEEHRKVMILGPVMGLSYQDIAEVIGETVPVVKGRLFRARQKFKKMFEAHMAGANFEKVSHTKAGD